MEFISFKSKAINGLLGLMKVKPFDMPPTIDYGLWLRKATLFSHNNIEMNYRCFMMASVDMRRYNVHVNVWLGV